MILQLLWWSFCLEISIARQRAEWVNVYLEFFPDVGFDLVANVFHGNDNPVVYRSTASDVRYMPLIVEFAINRTV